jgi:hypothetical protein
MAEEKAQRLPVRDYLGWEKKRAYITLEKLDTLKKDQPEMIQEGNSVRPDRVQSDGIWYGLELPDGQGRRFLVRLK